MPEDLVVSTFRVGKTVCEFLTDQIVILQHTAIFNKSSLPTDNITPLVHISIQNKLKNMFPIAADKSLPCFTISPGSNNN